MYPNTEVTILASFGKNKQSNVKKSLRLLHDISDEIIFTKFYIVRQIKPILMHRLIPNKIIRLNNTSLDLLDLYISYGIKPPKLQSNLRKIIYFIF